MKFSFMFSFRLFIFVMCILCLTPFLQAHAQKVVEVESDIMMGLDSEEKVEQLQDEMIADVEIETEFVADETLKRRGSVKAEMSEKAAGEDDRDVLEQELLDAELEAAQADLLSEEEILKINESLRRAIRQNRRLQEEKEKLNSELQVLRGEQRIQNGRVQVMEERMGDYKKQVERAALMKKEFDETVEDLQDKIKMRETALLLRIDELQNELANGIEGGLEESSMAASSGGERVSGAQQTGLDVIHLLDEMEDMRQEMRTDEAKVHYNMGNIFFHQGKYDDAVTEYQKTLEIAPSDVNAHFNLAYIYGEFLHKYESAIEHYKQYLHLNPTAEDAPLVQEKIIEAQLFVRTGMNIDVDKDVYDNKPFRSYTW